MPLELYIGPMFAGKSTEILGIVRRNTFIRRKTVCITHAIDTRYGRTGEIVSHNSDSVPALVTTRLLPLLKDTAVRTADCIIIEEAQFFPDLKAFVIPLVDTHKKHVICVGLDGDSNRAPFGQVLDLVPHADAIHKLKALCTRCADGTPALFTYRTASAPTAQINVGAAEQYEALCRTHYLEGEAEKAMSGNNSALRRFFDTYIEPVALTASEALDRCILFLGVERGAAAFEKWSTIRNE
jgi:thymidine kinase